MKNLKYKLIYILFPLLIASIIFSNAGELNDMVIIVNGGNPVNTMTRSEVKLTYMRKINKRWKEMNKNIVPVERKGDAETKKTFLKEIVQMTSDELSRYFTEREYQNAESAPVKLSTDEEIVDYVEANVGAIGYVSKGSIKYGKKVKIVFSL